MLGQRSPWSENSRVTLKVADTADHELIGRRYRGTIVEVRPSSEPNARKAALVRLDDPLAEAVHNIVMFERPRPGLWFWPQLVAVVPWPDVAKRDFATTDVLMRAIFIAVVRIETA